ncbi:MAG: ribbon-helix-helix domain-containing protein [Anaerolineae bacterium]|jgi:metal-responsive CopG/Arc/MetJ family transcriptional regulator|nr:ribbon-helix-helix domain-containing protein [Anaerolineae bacterium]
MEDRMQVNVRLTPELIEAIDRKRIELQPVMGKILTRSDVVRHALENYLLGQAKRMQGPTTRNARRSKSGK